MSAGVVGAYEIPHREIPDTDLIDVFGIAAHGALTDAGLVPEQVDGLFLTNLPGLVPALAFAEYLGIEPRWSDATRIGGASAIAHIHHALSAIQSGACAVALVVYGSLSRSDRIGIGTGGVLSEISDVRESVYGATVAARYAMFASRHMHEYGTTLEQLAAPAVSASQWGALNPLAVRPETLTVEDVLAAPVIAEPLTLPMCCVITDGGGALVLARNDIAESCRHRPIRILGSGEAVGHREAGTRLGFTESATVVAAEAAFAGAGCTPADVDFCMLYDSFTITVITALEDIGFCKKGEGGAFVADGVLGPDGGLPTNMDGGGLRNNHPGMRGIFLVIEAVKQLRGECGPRQVRNARVGLANGTGGTLDARHSAATLILASAE